MIAEKEEPQWNNDDSIHHPLGKIEFKSEVTLLQADFAANGGGWRGLVIIRKAGNGIDVQEWVSGHFQTSDSNQVPMRIYETRGPSGTQVSDSINMPDVTKALLLQYGITATDLSTQQLDSACYNRVYTQRLPNGTTVVISRSK